MYIPTKRIPEAIDNHTAKSSANFTVNLHDLNFFFFFFFFSRETMHSIDLLSIQTQPHHMYYDETWQIDYG